MQGEEEEEKCRTRRRRRMNAGKGGRDTRGELQPDFTRDIMLAPPPFPFPANIICQILSKMHASKHLYTHVSEAPSFRLIMISLELISR